MVGTLFQIKTPSVIILPQFLTTCSKHSQTTFSLTGITGVIHSIFWSKYIRTAQVLVKGFNVKINHWRPQENLCS